jgi:hypothetical protein
MRNGARRHTSTAATASAGTRASSTSRRAGLLVRVGGADQAAFETFYMNRLAELPCLVRVNSQFTMKMVKRGGGLPL